MARYSASICVGIPFYGTNPERIRNRNYVAKYLVDNLSSEGFDVVLRHNDPNITERGAARNDITKWAYRNKFPVMVMADADCVPEVQPLVQAIAGAADQGGLHFAFHKYRELTREGTKLWVRGLKDEAVRTLVYSCEGSYGGTMVMPPADWVRCGGSPHLVGWGFEDIIFSIQARTILEKPTVWYDGWLTHLWHQSNIAIGSDSYKRNIAICRRFEAVHDNASELWRLIKEGVGFHPGSDYWEY